MIRIVTVTEQNRHSFEDLVPEEFIDPLDKEGHFVLGAVGEDEEGQYAAGVLSFYIQPDYIDDEEIFTGVMQWLYVAEEFRGRGAGDALTGEFFRLLGGADIPVAFCDVPLGIEYLNIVTYLESWDFEFRLMDWHEARVTMERLQQIPQIWKKPKENVYSLSKIPPELLEKLTEKTESMPDAPYDLRDKVNHCDTQVSCVYTDEKKSIKGLGIVCPVMGGTLEVVFLHSFIKDSNTKVEMIRFMAQRAFEKYGKDIEVRFMCYRAGAVNFVESILPDVQPLLVYRGACSVFEEGEE